MADKVLVVQGGRLIDGTGRPPIEDSVIVIRDADSMDILHTLETGRTNAIQFTADGKKLVVGDEDGVVRIWAVE